MRVKRASFSVNVERLNQVWKYTIPGLALEAIYYLRKSTEKK